ncbi:MULTISPECIES: TRAP transporter large permease [unclassified Carboxydocella]|uniref:TRAP transporter large permease n=1 Tax=unclassified Carboxydocella TaxID=2685367 RepID=UPI0009AD73CB|nr:MULTISPECIES: TRAP transporter large permease subunit [unclassified Carboxydocella]GAW29930.1 C4-dicarboxylate ABC transporter permease [Carboxydocella sp. ULO1]GAW30468.1 C4-dicarboxylate ABC transporter permease [Carboxydocella sp. JDF658]
MTVMTTTTLLFSLFIILFLLNVPIAVSLGTAASIILYLGGKFSLYMIVQRMFSALLAPPLIAIPAFVMAGVLMSRGGIAKYLIAALRAWIGHLPGGLSVVTILACAIFAAISGSSPATAAAIGALMLPAMIEGGYPKRYAMGLIAASGTLGILIPPSVTLIIYGITVEESIGKLFMGGLLPGLFMALVLIISAIIYAKKNGFGRGEKATMEERWRATFKALPGAFLPVFILGSIYSGIVTPTEAAVLSVFYTIIVSVFIYRELSWKDIRPALRDATNTISMIYLVIAAAMVFSLYITDAQVPNLVGDWIKTANLNKFTFFLVTNLMFFIMGTFLEAVSITLITLPILLPMIEHLGIDLIQFAIVMTVNMELAMITPPVGLNLFVVSNMARERLEEVVKGVVPFIVLMIAVMILLMVWPDISLYIPRVLMAD